MALTHGCAIDLIGQAEIDARTLTLVTNVVTGSIVSIVTRSPVDHARTIETLTSETRAGFAANIQWTSDTDT